uniref:Uncharacterized protein n=1 Tax=Glycine max TaxID=3847 RepID=K7LA87_SOYBN
MDTIRRNSVAAPPTGTVCLTPSLFSAASFMLFLALRELLTYYCCKQLQKHFSLLPSPVSNMRPCPCCYVQPLEESSISGVISDKGLEYAKELLIEKGIASIVMLQLPEIENFVQVPLVGN